MHIISMFSILFVYEISQKPGLNMVFSVLAVQLNGSVKEPNLFHNYETEKITPKVGDATENLQLYRVVWFFHPRSSCTTTHLMLFSERQLIYA